MARLAADANAKVLAAGLEMAEADATYEVEGDVGVHDHGHIPTTHVDVHVLALKVLIRYSCQVEREIAEPAAGRRVGALSEGSDAVKRGAGAPRGKEGWPRWST